MVESKSKVRLEEANVKYDDNSDEGIVGDGAETLMVRKSLMTQKEDDSFNSLIFDEYSDDECDPTHMQQRCEGS